MLDGHARFFSNNFHEWQKKIDSDIKSKHNVGLLRNNMDIQYRMYTYERIIDIWFLTIHQHQSNQI